MEKVGSEFRVWELGVRGLKFRDLGLGFGVWGLGLRLLGFEVMVCSKGSGIGFRVGGVKTFGSGVSFENWELSFGFGVWGLGFGVNGLEFRVSYSGCRALPLEIEVQGVNFGSSSFRFDGLGSNLGVEGSRSGA